jgi:hypothetical protein
MSLKRPHRRPSPREWLVFAASLLAIEIVDASADIIRGDLFPPSARLAVEHGRAVANLESAYGFFAEPGLYRFAQHSHDVLGVTLSSSLIIGTANNIYAFFHIGVPILTLAWLYVRHWRSFRLLRNAFIIVTAVALAGYFIYPTAPPRLTTGLVYAGHAFIFHNTMPYPKAGLTVNGRPLGFDPYAAMPSLHLAWASAVTAAIMLLARNPLVRVLIPIYPVIMTLAVVVTANHYILDAVGGVLALAVAAPLTVALTRIVPTG